MILYFKSPSTKSASYIRTNRDSRELCLPQLNPGLSTQSSSGTNPKFGSLPQYRYMKYGSCEAHVRLQVWHMHPGGERCLRFATRTHAAVLHCYPPPQLEPARSIAAVAAPDIQAGMDRPDTVCSNPRLSLFRLAAYHLLLAKNPHRRPWGVHRRRTLTPARWAPPRIKEMHAPALSTSASVPLPPQQQQL